MRTVLFNQEEIDLSTKISSKVFWHPKSSDWFIDFNNVRVLYDGSYQQSMSLCLVLDEDGRSFSFLELLIDGEENGNRMKKSVSYDEVEELNNMIWMPNIKDCIDIIDLSEKFSFLKLEKVNDLFKVEIKDLSNEKIYSYTNNTELLTFYNTIWDIYKDE